MPWPDVVIGVVAALLLLNLVVALAIFASRGSGGGWLLVILLTSTTGAALTALLASLAGRSERFLDVGLMFVGLAALTAGVRAVAGARGR